MLLRAMLIDALHAALEDRIVAFHRVRGDDLFALAAHVFLASVVNAVMAGKLAILVHVPN